MKFLRFCTFLLPGISLTLVICLSLCGEQKKEALLPSMLQVLCDQTVLPDYLRNQSVEKYVMNPLYIPLHEEADEVTALGPEKIEDEVEEIVIDSEPAAPAPITVGQSTLSVLKSEPSEKHEPIAAKTEPVSKHECANVKNKPDVCLSKPDAMTQKPIAKEQGCAERCWDFKFCVGAFIHQSSLFRRIYGNACPYYGVEATYYLHNCLGLWGNADYSPKNGCSIGLNSPTNIKIVNFSLGLKAVWDFCSCSDVYLGVGPCVAGVWLKNCSNCLFENISKATGGVVLKSGLDWRVWDCGLITLNVDYVFESISFSRHMEIGGLKIGAAIGLSF